MMAITATPPTTEPPMTAASDELGLSEPEELEVFVAVITGECISFHSS